MAEARIVERAQYLLAPKPGARRVEKYRRKREDGVSKAAYESATTGELVDKLIDIAQDDLATLDTIVGRILTRHGVYGNLRIPYLNFARELYAFGRKYGRVPPDYVRALRLEKALKGATAADVLSEIEDSVLMFLGITVASTPAPVVTL